MRDVPIADLLSRAGLEGDDAERGLAALCDAGLTRSGKKNIAENKIEAARNVLRGAFFRTCHKPACREEARRAGRAVVETAAEHCDGCGGEDNRAAVEKMLAGMRSAGRTKLLVVGGAPNSRDELKSLCGRRCELRFLTNDDRPGGKVVDRHVAWADVAVIWASTQLDHKMTQKIRGPHVITCGRRGIAALAQSVLRHVDGK